MGVQKNNSPQTPTARISEIVLSASRLPKAQRGGGILGLVLAGVPAGYPGTSLQGGGAATSTKKSSISVDAQISPAYSVPFVASGPGHADKGSHQKHDPLPQNFWTSLSQSSTACSEVLPVSAAGSSTAELFRLAAPLKSHVAGVISINKAAVYGSRWGYRVPLKNGRLSL
eukprot:1377471-Rhodomonas_salina.1